MGRVVRGFTRKLPDRGAPVDDHSRFDVASLTKPMVTVACAMVLVAEGRLDRHADPAMAAGFVTAVGRCDGTRAARSRRRLQPARRAVSLVARRAARRSTRASSSRARSASRPTRRRRRTATSATSRSARSSSAPPTRRSSARSPAVAEPLGLAACFAPSPLAGAVATELDERGLVCGLVHDENAYWGGRVCGHAGLFASIDDVARFAAAMVTPRDRFRPEVVSRFFGDAPTQGASWRLGWDTPSATAGVSHAGDRWPRTGAVGHAGFTGTSLWLDLPNGRWVALLANRVHPTRFHGSADAMKALRRAVADAVVARARVKLSGLTACTACSQLGHCPCSAAGTVSTKTTCCAQWREFTGPRGPTSTC